ncbi:MAG TPA: hypothetical protein VNP20_23670 [Nocardioidaceae bacterium]|nr:hypothetical protein [Nocardioidaceae bacterium]
MTRSVVAVVAGVTGALAFGLVGLALAAGPATSSGTPAVVVRADDGDLLASVPVGRRGFALSYRNSVYGTRAEDRYTLATPGRFRLVEVAADQRAVLEEYYALPGPSRAAAGDRRNWVSDPARRMLFRELNIAATDLGERTLHVPGHRPVPLWRLVGDGDPIVVLDIEENPQ